MRVRTGKWIGLAWVLGAVLAAIALVFIVASLPADTITYGDGVADGKKSIAGAGHLTSFAAPGEGMWLNRVEVFGARYGTSEPPDENFDLYILDSKAAIIKHIALPYCLWERKSEYWRDLPIPPIKVPQTFGVGVVFNPGRTKGVYVGTDNVTQSHSCTWTPERTGSLLQGQDWMIRVSVDPDPVGDPEATDLVVMQNGDAYIDRFVGAAGDPLRIDTARHAQIDPADIAGLYMNVVLSPTKQPACVVMCGGLRVNCSITSADADALTVKDQFGNSRRLPRADIARIEFN